MGEQQRRPPTRAGHVLAARGFLTRRLMVDIVLLAVGVLLLATGITGFTVLGSRSDQLARSGVLATATAVAVDNYHHRFQFDEHVDVIFRVSGESVVASCYIGAGDQFAVGQPVPIVYDPTDPEHAQLAGDPSLGPAAAPFLGFLVLGLVVIAAGGYGLWIRRGVGAALRDPDRAMTAARFARRRMTLRGQGDPLDGLELRVRGQVRRFPGDADTAVRVFGRTDPRSVLVVVDPSNSAVAFGRIPREVADPAESKVTTT
jgi:hypothetical protein